MSSHSYFQPQDFPTVWVSYQAGEAPFPICASSAFTPHLWLHAYTPHFSLERADVWEARAWLGPSSTWVGITGAGELDADVQGQGVGAGERCWCSGPAASLAQHSCAAPARKEAAQSIHGQQPSLVFSQFMTLGRNSLSIPFFP